jgi:hypothetical protein
MRKNKATTRDRFLLHQKREAWSNRDAIGAGGREVRNRHPARRDQVKAQSQGKESVAPYLGHPGPRSLLKVSLGPSPRLRADRLRRIRRREGSRRLRQRKEGICFVPPLKAPEPSRATGQ